MWLMYITRLKDVYNVLKWHCYGLKYVMWDINIKLLDIEHGYLVRMLNMI